MATTAKEIFEEQQARWAAEIAATPAPMIGDWVMDWGGLPIIVWDKRHAARLAKYPSMARYISEIRRADGFTWARAKR